MAYAMRRAFEEVTLKSPPVREGGLIEALKMQGATPAIGLARDAHERGLKLFI